MPTLRRPARNGTSGRSQHCLSEASPNAMKREARNEPERNKRGMNVTLSIAERSQHCLSEASPNGMKREARNEPERNKRGM
jgi:hypothetical protein